MTDEESIFAYIDGELEGDDLVRVEAAIAAAPALQAMVAEHRALASHLRGAYSAILDEPLPPLMPAATAPGSNVHSLADARNNRERRASAWGLPQWSAMAATLVAGIIGGSFLNGTHSGLIAQRGGHLVVSGQIEQALDTQLASTQSPSAAVRIGLTFKDREGAICRSFTAEAAEGVACRDRNAWQVRGLLGREGGQSGDYRLAASSRIADLVDDLIVGEPLDAADERAALEKRWVSTKQP
ncbi:hypothetical protein GCM10009087_15740 [Sphingomonas oligophenolica]|uniref:Anti-sigma factor n=1 Tax=Sphingomonas oligophenolica TaxID=301154 RepID=A0ABU9Y889_9SPHN